MIPRQLARNRQPNSTRGYSRQGVFSRWLFYHGETEMRKFSEMTEDQWTPIYRRCMKLADEAGKAEYAALPEKERKRQIKQKGFFYSHQAKFWVDLWAKFAKDELDEEEIKETFAFRDF
jgi:hypothetical protein